MRFFKTLISFLKFLQKTSEWRDCHSAPTQHRTNQSSFLTSLLSPHLRTFGKNIYIHTYIKISISESIIHCVVTTTFVVHYSTGDPASLHLSTGFQRVGERIKIPCSSWESKVYLFLCNFPTLRRAMVKEKRKQLIQITVPFNSSSNILGAKTSLIS